MKNIKRKCCTAGGIHTWFLRAVLLCIGLILYSCSQSQQSKRASLELAQRPNFLVIISDDQTYDTIHALNNEEIITPNLDKLAKRGVVFTHAFNPGSWSGAVCVASRTMILTGQTLFHAARNTAYLAEWARLQVPEIYRLQNDREKSSAPTEVKTWPEVFSEAGYLTWMTGKWHNTDLALLRGFNEARAIGAGMYETFDEAGSSNLAYGRPNNSRWVPWEPLFKGHWTPAVKDLIYSESGDKKTGPPYTVNQHSSEL
jgi:choline-sulfatase